MNHRGLLSLATSHPYCCSERFSLFLSVSFLCVHHATPDRKRRYDQMDESFQISSSSQIFPKAVILKMESVFSSVIHICD